MNSQLLPIGSVIELSNKNKYVVLGYEEDNNGNLKYMTCQYPSFVITDLIPLNKQKEFSQKYKINLSNELAIDINSEYKVLHEGYKNNKYYEMLEKFGEIK